MYQLSIEDGLERALLIPLFKAGRNKDIYAIVSLCDFDYLSQWHWYLVGGYASRVSFDGGHRVSISMHRTIMNFPDGMVVHHINRDKLDNRRNNLRICTAAENIRNKKRRYDATSRYKGISHSGNPNRWYAYIYVNHKNLYLGAFDTELDAAKAYDVAALNFYKEFARLNFPQE